MMKTCVLLGGLLCVAVGCSATTSLPATSVTPQVTPLKTVVEGVAKTGEIGSGVMELTDKFAELKKSDASKADAIKADFDKLLKADGNPEQVKRLATELAKKL